jgi:hypothetical protein
MNLWPLVPLLLLGPPFYPNIVFVSTTLLTGMTGISLHMQRPLTSQSNGHTKISMAWTLLSTFANQLGRIPAEKYIYSICSRRSFWPQSMATVCTQHFETLKWQTTLGARLTKSISANAWPFGRIFSEKYRPNYFEAIILKNHPKLNIFILS